MKTSTMILTGTVAVAAGLLFFGRSSTGGGAAPAPAPGPPGPPGARRFLGDAVLEGDVVNVDPTALTSLFQAPAGAVSVVMSVDQASADLLTGRVLGVSMTTGNQPIGPFGPFTVPRSAVVAIQRHGQPVA